MQAPLNRHLAPGQTQGGFTLIEALVALLVVAIGMLGMAKLQAYSIANTAQSGKRGVVAMQADSLAAILQGSRALIIGGGGPTWPVVISAGSVKPNGGSALSSNGCTSGSSCTTANLLTADLVDWAGVMYALVPSATTTLTCTPSTGATPTHCTIEVSWLENQAGNGSIANGNANGNNVQVAPAPYFQYVEP